VFAGSPQRSTPVQIEPTPLYHHGLVERVIAYLQTRDPSLFPFTARFDEERQKAFINDLRTGLSDLTESGSKRGTSASGFITSDKRLREIVDNWADAGGSWPETQDPTNPFGLAGVAPFDPDPVR
jgi:hypothetical protein